MRKAILQEYCSCSVQKARRKNSKYSRNFENWPPLKGYRLCKDYNLCKMVSFGQKLTMPKRCEELFYKKIRVVLCEKPLKKAPNVREMRQI